MLPEPPYSHGTQPRIGVLLINLGTPEAPTAEAVRAYLKEFLSDPRVVEIPRLVWLPILNLFVLATRPKASAQRYAQVWMSEGSPLRVHTERQTTLLRNYLEERAQQLPLVVDYAMRYGKPSIADGLAALDAAKVDRIVVLPLFPQYATSSTGTAVARVMELAQARWTMPAFDFVPAFYDDPGFLAAFEAVAKPVLADAKPDHVLFSFHGLPVRQITKTDTGGTHCFASEHCCDSLANPNCYRAQSFATARALATRLALPAEQYTVCFQSRLGRTPWIQPFTDALLDELPKKGIKRLAVLCPAFVADCLETLEEIGIRAGEQWKAAGGEELTLVPSLNATAPWIDAVAAIARRHAAHKSLPMVG